MGEEKYKERTALNPTVWKPKKGYEYNPLHSVVGRNDPCPCGSGKKWKKCHMDVAPRIVPVENIKRSLGKK